MLLFHCTKDAIEALTATHQGKTHCWVDNAPPPEGAQPWGWQLHAVKIARRQVLVAMHGDTRFVMVFWGLKKGDGKTLLSMFYERVANHLIWLAEDSGVMDRPAARNMFDRLMRSHGSFRFHSGSDRSVQAHINEVVRLCRQAVADNGGDLPDNYEQAGMFDVFLNQGIRRVKGGDYFMPADAWLSACLRDFADFDAEALAQLCQRRQAQRQYAMVEQLLQAAKDRGLSPDDPTYVQMVQWLEHTAVSNTKCNRVNV